MKAAMGVFTADTYHKLQPGLCKFLVDRMSTASGTQNPFYLHSDWSSADTGVPDPCVHALRYTGRDYLAAPCHELKINQSAVPVRKLTHSTIYNVDLYSCAACVTISMVVESFITGA
jgi:hypothetical protein